MRHKCVELTGFVVSVTNVQLCATTKPDQPLKTLVREEKTFRYQTCERVTMYLELAHETVGPQRIRIVYLQRRRERVVVYTWRCAFFRRRSRVPTRKLTCLSNRSEGSMWTLKKNIYIKIKRTIHRHRAQPTLEYVKAFRCLQPCVCVCV